MDKCEKVPKLQRFRSEEEFAQTWDRCITDMIVKMGGGLGLGMVFSLFLFGRRGWPIYFGMGSGFGIAYNNCQTAFNGPILNHQLRPRCSPHVQLARRRCEKPANPCVDPCKKEACEKQPTVLVCMEQPAPMTCQMPPQTCQTPPQTCQTPPQTCQMPTCETPTCEMPKREEPWTAHTGYGHATTNGNYDSTHPHYNTVGQTQQVVPPCPEELPPCCEPPKVDPRDTCRFKSRM